MKTIDLATVTFCSLVTGTPGSSRTNLTRLLSDPKAPFYQSVERIDLPDLGRDYTDFVAGQLRELGNVRVSKAACWDAFNAFDRSPYHMEAFVRALLLKRAANANAAVEIVLEGIGNDPHYLVRWQRLRPIDRAVYLLVCDGIGPYSSQALERLSQELDTPVTTSSVQRPLQRLTKEGFVSTQGRGEYRNEDSDFLSWLRYQLPSKEKTGQGPP